MKTERKLLAVVLGTFSVAALGDTATVYFNGDILTMQGDSPRYVPAVVTQGDRISFTGELPQAMAKAGPDPVLHDLKGHTLLPGFIDSWGHFALVAQDTLGVNVAYFSDQPPNTKSQIIERLRKEAKPFNGWIVGTGYSDALLADGALSLADLDAANPS